MKEGIFSHCGCGWERKGAIMGERKEEEERARFWEREREREREREKGLGLRWGDETGLG